MRERGLSPGLVTAVALCSVLVAMSAVQGTSERGESRPAPDGWSLEGDPDNGELTYKQYCQKCHGKRGNGQGTMAADLAIKPRDFTDVDVMSKRSDWEIYLGIKEGGPPVGLSEQMTAWEDTFSEEEMMDVATFIRQFVEPDE